MGRLTGAIPFTGSIAGLSAYTRRDLDKVIIRTKGGATKAQIKKKPSFENTRRLNKEWEGVAAMSKAIRQNIYAVKHLADYNFTGSINALCKKMEYADTVSDYGKRSVLLSHCRYMLEGFSLNKRISFDTVLRQPIDCMIDRNNNSTQFTIPAIHPSINFINPGKNPIYRFVFMAGFLSDLLYNEKRDGYFANTLQIPGSVYSCTEWVSVQKNTQAEEIILQPDHPVELDETVTIVASAGIEFGIPAADGSIEYVKYSGCAKVLKLG